MSLSESDILGWSRVFTLLLGMGWAAWMDHKERRVKNEHWMVWIKPALFLWALDLMVQGADWTIYLTASAAVAYASGAVLGRPTINDIRAGSRIDQVVSVWYIVSIFGLVYGAYSYQNVHPLDVLLGNQQGLGALWWSTFAVIPLIFIIDLAWRLRMLHGGADAKALMWVAILLPSWSSLPLFYPEHTETALFALPPAFALLMWGGFSFLLIPIVLFSLNVMRGNVRSLRDLSMAWHALYIPRTEVLDRHVWLLTSLVEKPDGQREIYHSKRAPRRSPSKEEVVEKLNELKQEGVNHVWVSQKLPLLVFLFPAILPLCLFGDPMAILMPAFGLS